MTPEQLDAATARLRESAGARYQVALTGSETIDERFLMYDSRAARLGWQPVIGLWVGRPARSIPLRFAVALPVGNVDAPASGATSGDPWDRLPPVFRNLTPDAWSVPVLMAICAYTGIHPADVDPNLRKDLEAFKSGFNALVSRSSLGWSYWPGASVGSAFALAPVPVTRPTTRPPITEDEDQVPVRVEITWCNHGSCRYREDMTGFATYNVPRSVFEDGEEGVRAYLYEHVDDLYADASENGNPESTDTNYDDYETNETGENISVEEIAEGQLSRLVETVQAELREAQRRENEEADADDEPEDETGNEA